MRFVDEVTLEAVAGDGGNGAIAFRREKFVPFGGPAGGDGGRGGDVIFEGDEGLSTLMDLKYARKIKAEKGHNGEGKDKYGRAGKDKILRVPVGTQIYDWRAGNDLGEWREELTHGWNFDEVESLVRSHIHDIEMQGAEHQNPFKCSWYWDDRTREDLDRLNELLIEAGLRAQIVYSSRRDLDILPEKANKGNAISWLAGFLGIPFARIAVAGDSGNDASMFFVDDVHGIIVGNAESALPAAASGADIFHSARPCVEGVIEGLSRHLELDRPSHS